VHLEGLLAVVGEEVGLVLAGIGLFHAIFHWFADEDRTRVHLIRFLAAYTFAVTMIYGLIPYKTPWCLLQFWFGMVLLAGVGASVLLGAVHPRWARIIIAGLLLLGGGHLGWQAYRASFVFPAEVGNPYVYAHTSAEIRRLNAQLQGLAETSRDGWQTPVKVIWTDAYYWPLPWYLRRFEQVELWRSMPDDYRAPIVLAAPQYAAQLDAAFGRDYIMVLHELRPQVFLQLWVKFDLWEAYLRRIGRIE